ncbi:MAG: glycoside hydrolase [Syntrophus sp. (in: bacteria)]|nr:glycoside hydrolase [Syntrophus sp. (in: bacteria)]
MEEKKARKRVTFKLHAPEAQRVFVAGSFNNWNMESLPLKEDKKSGDDVWQRIIYLEPGEYTYRFIVDGSWCDDPNCPEWLGNEFGTCDSILRIQGDDKPAARKKTAK